MKIHTNEFKQKIKEFGRKIDSKITYTIDEEEIELGSEDLNSVSLHYEGSILKSVMKQLDIDSNIEIPLNTIINYNLGIKVSNEEVIDYRDNYEYLDYGNFIVYNVEKQEDTGSYKITCYDKMLYAMKDYEDMNIIYPIIVRNYLYEVCNYLGLTFANGGDTFANYNKQIPIELYLDSQGNSLGYTFRDVLDELAQVTASTICINDNDELEIRYINNTGDTIDEEYLKDVNVNFGETTKPINTIVLSRAGGSDKIYLSYPEDLPEDERNSIEIADNQIMNFNDRDTYLSDILNKLNGLSYSLNDYTSTGICYYDLCDRYNVQIGENTYSCVMFNDEINVTQGLEEIVHTDLPEETETDYTKADKTDRRINQTYLIVDKQNQTIESVVSSVGEQNSKISQITQTVNEINSKISDIADITITNETTLATMTMEDINASEPIELRVRPITKNISYVYPSNYLYSADQYYPAKEGLVPSNTLVPSNSLVPQSGYPEQNIIYSKTRKIRFYNSTDEEVIYDYVLPEDLLYYNSENYDEFILNYGEGTQQTQICQVVKKCKYNADGTVSLLTTPETHNYAYPTINLTDGNYVISLVGYDVGYIFARLMVKNIYTTQFYTKAETNSHINQKASEIELGVEQTLSNYSTTAQMNSAITLKANEINSVVSQKVGNNEIISKINQTPETITINANKVNLQGYVTVSALSGSGTTTINGSNITTGTIKSSNYVSGTSGTSLNLSNGVIDTKGFKVSSAGALTASSGTIGGWNITTGYLQKTSGNYSAEIRADSNSNNAIFLIWDNSNNRYNWYVNGNGKMYARNCEISGTIYSGSGTIGGWDIANSRLRGLTGQSGVYGAIRPYGVQLEDASGNILSSAGWGSIIIASSSDKRIKHDIIDIDEKFEKLFDDLKPVTFYFNKELGDDKKHIGFIAQDILKSQEKINEDLAMVQEDSLSKKYNLIKQEIIALNTWQIQKLKEENKLMKKQIEELQQRIKKLERESDK